MSDRKHHEKPEPPAKDNPNEEHIELAKKYKRRTELIKLLEQKFDDLSDQQFEHHCNVMSEDELLICACHNKSYQLRENAYWRTQYKITIDTLRNYYTTDVSISKNIAQLNLVFNALFHLIGTNTTNQEETYNQLSHAVEDWKAMLEDE